MHTVKRAIILAAGRGERLRPVTDTMPKSLVPIHGRRMIDTIINALYQNGIREIYVVVGYLKEQFQTLLEKYPDITLLENPYYHQTNNITSLYTAREYLEDVMILDGDQVIYTDAVLSPYFERSGYNAVWTQEPTSEWLLQVQEGLVTACSRTGGSRGWQLYSVSRWTAEDGRKLKRHLEREFAEKGNREIFWDDLPLHLYPQDYRLGIFPMNRGDVVEIDSLAELKELDCAYKDVPDEAETGQTGILAGSGSG